MIGITFHPHPNCNHINKCYNYIMTTFSLRFSSDADNVHLTSVCIIIIIIRQTSGTSSSVGFLPTSNPNQFQT